MNALPLRYEPGFEAPEEDEAQTTAELVQTLVKISDITFKDSGQGLRSVHAKSHALLQGELHVIPLPPELAQGLFAVPRTFAAMVRISTSPGDLLDDSISAPRGFALKVIGVEGEHLPRQAGTQAPITQDFLLVNGPAFLAPTAKKFLGNLKLLASTTDKIPHLKKAFSAVLRGAEKTVEALGGESGTLKGLGGHPKTNPLGETYFSQVPFLFGPYMAKWSIAPVSPSLIALKDAEVDLHDKPDGLREALNSYFATQAGEWELRVQLCTDLKTMPIEDASVPWPEDKSPFIPVARLVVAPQTGWSEEKSKQMDDGLAFSPWHGLAAHRPLGSINRARQAAYRSSSEARSPRGRCPVHEPISSID
jgi:hypothetical protein